MKHNMKKLETELKEKIDSNSQMQIEKVVRYLNLVKLFYELDEYIKDTGPVVLTENGAQKFVKVNPAIQEKNRINAQILAIEKSFDFAVVNGPPADGSDLL